MNIKIVKEAAQEIQWALQESANRKRDTIVIFVCTLHAGTVYVEDLKTIDCVTRAIKNLEGKPLTCNDYAILYNQIPQTIMDRKDWTTGKFSLQESFSTQRDDFITTNHFIYVPKFCHLEGADNARITEDQLVEMKLYEKVLTCPRIRIGYVDEIDTNKLTIVLSKIL